MQYIAHVGSDGKELEQPLNKAGILHSETEYVNNTETMKSIIETKVNLSLQQQY